jgi:RNA polymerase sigma-70 factor (sigma-E family)
VAAPVSLRAEVWVSEHRISARDAEELAACFTAHARSLFGYACVVTRGDRVLAEDLVQAAFESAGRAWCTLRCVAEDQRGGWLSATLVNIAVSSSGRDELLSRLCQQVTEGQAARFAAEYDAAAGLDRYQGWLRDHAAEDQAGLEAVQAGVAMALQAGVGGTFAPGPDPGGTGASGRTARRPAPRHAQTFRASVDRDADRAVTALYGSHYRSLVGLATLLVRDESVAEEVVQDSFVAMHSAWPRLADRDRALSYLRQSVARRCRLVLQHRLVPGKLAPGQPDAGPDPVRRTEPSGVISALHALPSRQREALVLRYYGGLSEAQIASVMGISAGAVKTHTARAMAALRSELSKADD